MPGCQGMAKGGRWVNRDRPVCIPTKRMTKESLRLGRLLYPEAMTDYWRPKTRADCSTFERPCPYVSCRFNLYLDVTSVGSIKLNFPHLEPWEMDESCSLDVIERRGQMKLEDIAVIMNIGSRERVRQIEMECLSKIRPFLRLVGSLEREDEVDMVRAWVPEWLRQGWW